MIYKQMLIIAIAGALLTSATPQEQDSDTAKIEKAVLAQLAKIQEAAESMDADKVFSYVLENDKGAVITDGRLAITRTEALEATKQGFKGLQSVKYKFYEQHVTTLSTNTAMAVGEGSTTFTLADGRTITAPFAQTVIFKLNDGEWKVFHAHRSFPQPR